MPGMPLPDWYQEAKEKMSEVIAEPLPDMESFPELEVLEDFPYLFVEYTIKENDVLLHFFPRNGLEDHWVDGHYINRCRNCHAEVPMPSRPSQMKACPRCRHTGLIYVPGRAEQQGSVKFPENARDLIKQAVDVVWLGNVAVDYVPELEAYAVQLQGARSTAMLAGLETLVTKISQAFNELLAPRH